MTMPAAGAAARFRLDGRHALVTGGASGIGLAAVAALAECGARVTILDLRLEAGEVARESLRARALDANLVACDVADEHSVEAAFTAAERDGGVASVLVTSAGVARRAPAVDVALADWQRVVDVNLTGVFLCARRFARPLLAAGRPGAIVAVASIMGLSGGGLYPNVSYQTTKGGVVNMTRALAIEWARNAIRVNAVAPTYVRTPFIAPLLEDPELVAAIERITPLGRLAEPDDVAAAIVFLASDAASMVTGHVLAVDGGFLAQ